MLTLIIYYSRTGTTAKVADSLALEFDAEVQEIECAEYGMGAIRYLLAGYNSVRGNLPEIETPEFAVDAFDLLLLGAPIWTSYPALPMRAFLAKTPELPTRIGLFLTYGGHSPPEKAIEFVRTTLSQPIEASLSLSSTEVAEGKLPAAVANFSGRISASAPGFA